jgi:DNA-binding CsgD family transcriptional regulator
MGNEAIALELGIAPGTVAKHLEHAYRKLGVPNRTAATRLLSNS